MDSQPLSILHTNFHRGWGGQPSRILMVSQGHTQRGHRVVIAAPAGSRLATRAEESGVGTFQEVQFLRSKHIISGIRDAAALSRLLHREKFDLIHAHGSQDLWNSAAARRMGRHSLPLIFTRHHTKKLVDHAFNRFLYRKVVDHLIVACASVLDRYRPFLERGDITEDRISIIHSAYREDRFHAGVDGSAIRHELGAGPETLLVGVVGRLQPEKGGMYFLRAAAKIAPAFPTARFLFVGRGSDEMLLKQTAAELGIADRVVFLGFREDIPEITAALDLSVLPSIDCDASSAVLKEAMAMGRPVVATTIGGAGDIVEADRTGLLVPHADPEALATAIGTILGMPDRGQAMGQRGQLRVVARFTRERLVEQTLATYRKVLERWRQQHQQGNNR